MNDVRVRPVREAGRVVGFAVDVRKDGAFENAGWFSSWDRAHTFAHRRAQRCAAQRVLDSSACDDVVESNPYVAYRDLGLNFRWV